MSIIGMAKNAGKTVTLNHLLELASLKRIVLGLTSIGRDGENQDLISATAKPPIYVYRGTLIATAASLLDTCTARLEILKSTNIHTAMGKIIIAKVKFDGYVQLAGPATTADTAKVKNWLNQYGATLVLVDGALDRRSTAAPSVTDATILATGAAVDRDIKKVVAQTVHRLTLFNLSIAEPPIVELAKQVIANANIGCIERTPTGYQTLSSNLPTALGAGAKLAALRNKQTAYIVLAGVLSEQIIDQYLESYGQLDDVIWLIQDATKIFVSRSRWHYYRKKKMRVEVLQPIKVIALTCNPTAPKGYQFDVGAFKADLQQAVGSLPVIDVMSEAIPWNF